MSRSPRLWAMRTAFRAMGAVAPGVAARWAETLFCTPPRRPGGDERFLAAGARFSLESQGQRLTGWEWGSGPAVVLVHGSECARSLSDVAARMGPIHGLVGHSLGGAAAAMAMRHGVGARRAVLLAPPADVRIFSDHFARTLAITPAVQETMHRNLERRLRIVWDDLHIPTLVRELPAAALVIHDRDDTDVPFAHGEEIVGAWAGSRLETTTGLGHRALLRDPAVIARTVGFLTEGAAG